MDFLEIVVGVCGIVVILVIACAGLGLAIGAFVGSVLWVVERVVGL